MFLSNQMNFLLLQKTHRLTLLIQTYTAKIFYANFGSLGNTSDGVVIYDFRNGIIDSLFYRSSWGGKKGYSLERISIN